MVTNWTKNYLQKTRLRTHTHIDGKVLSSNHTHTYRRSYYANVSFFSTCIKMGDNAQNIDTFDLNRARKLWLYTTCFFIFAAFLFAVHAFLLSLFVLCVSVLLFYLVYDLHLFVLVTLSICWTDSWFVVCFLFSFARFDYYWNN